MSSVAIAAPCGLLLNRTLERAEGKAACGTALGRGPDEIAGGDVSAVGENPSRCRPPTPR